MNVLAALARPSFRHSLSLRASGTGQLWIARAMPSESDLERACSNACVRLGVAEIIHSPPPVVSRQSALRARDTRRNYFTDCSIK